MSVDRYDCEPTKKCPDCEGSREYPWPIAVCGLCAGVGRVPISTLGSEELAYREEGQKPT